MDRKDRQLSDIELGRGCSETKKKKLRGGDDDGAEAVVLVNTEETDPKPAQNLRVCDFCNKTFTSGKALGGHRRSHFQFLKAEGSIKKKAKNHASIRRLSSKDETCGSANMNSIVAAGSMSRDEKKHSCYLCGKNFPSMKSLFGHMRSHPGREWKGILPPPTFSPTAADALAPQSEENSCSLSSTSSAPGECNDVHGDAYATMNPDASSNIPAAIPVDILKVMSEAVRWKATAKRGRKSVGAVAAAESLLLLSRGKYSPTKINNQCNEAAKISEFPLAEKRRGIDYRLADHDGKHKVRKIKLIRRREESVKLGDKAVDEVCKEGGNLHNSSSEQSMGNAHEDDDNNEVENYKQQPKESKNQEIEEGTQSQGTPVMKSGMPFEGVSESSKKKMNKKRIRNKKKIDMIMSNVHSCNTDSYKFGRSSKTLPSSSQFLRGQRSSLNKDNDSTVPSMVEETGTTPDASIVQKAEINEAKESESIEISNKLTDEANHNSKNCNKILTGSVAHASLGEAKQSCHGQGVSGEATDQSSGKMLDIDLNLPCSMEDEELESSFLQA